MNNEPIWRRGPERVLTNLPDWSPSCVYIRQATVLGYIKCKLPGIADLNYVNSRLRRARTIYEGEVINTLTTENMPNVIEPSDPWTYGIDGKKYRIRIRKLTPRECWRLMGFPDDAFDKAEKVCSSTQLYKQAGNSIVVDVLEAVFRPLHLEQIK